MAGVVSFVIIHFYQSYPLPGKGRFAGVVFQLTALAKTLIKSNTSKLLSEASRRFRNGCGHRMAANGTNLFWGDMGAAMLTCADTLLVIVDIQEKLVRAMHDRDDLIQKAQHLLLGAHALNIPILCTEQNPKGLGPTVPEIAAHLAPVHPISKFSFGCCACEEFTSALQAAACRNVLIAGIETHVCVYQTALELLAKGHHVEVVADACSSRTLSNKQIGLDKMRAAGAAVTSVETALFELLRVAEGPLFKQILNIVK
jgi:nicotinamidase-related amidase